jgi:hypothetical protein
VWLLVFPEPRKPVMMVMGIILRRMCGNDGRPAYLKLQALHFFVVATDKRGPVSLLPRSLCGAIASASNSRFLPHHPCASIAGLPNDVGRGPPSQGSRIQAHHTELLLPSPTILLMTLPYPN